MGIVEKERRPFFASGWWCFILFRGSIRGIYVGYKFKLPLEATQHGVAHVPCGEYSSFEGFVFFF